MAERASPAIAWDFVVGIRDLCLGLSTFPQRGRAGGDHAGGADRRAVSIVFAVDGEFVLIWASSTRAGISRPSRWKKGSEPQVKRLRRSTFG
ncbi:hypothetical protein [Mesorhizobium sp. CA7]|uniref:hypothetical protein n=1 Tax=Mesorhizobium sp. CA7 TaxID=588501 RepID=UPI0021E22982|nr:hypothetical protein [Mesorhizobium sp. CA7]